MMSGVMQFAVSVKGEVRLLRDTNDIQTRKHNIEVLAVSQVCANWLQKHPHLQPDGSSPH